MILEALKNVLMITLYKSYNIKEILDFFKKKGYYRQQIYKKTKKMFFVKIHGIINVEWGG